VETDRKRLMTVKDLAGYLRVHTTTVYRLLKCGRLPAFRVGSDWRFNVESIDRWRLDQDTPFMGARGERKLRLVHSRKNARRSAPTFASATFGP
jgi:excisionase family DNA binding protein